MPISKWLFGIICAGQLFLLAACHLPAPLERDSGGTDMATFFVAEAKGGSLTTTLTKDFSVPKSKIFNFTACVMDQAHSKPLVGHPFRIEEVGQNLKTDEKGCLNWNEEIAFNYFAAPHYLEWPRHIIATGLHKGRRLVRFAINPWNDNDKSLPVVNLETTTPPKLVSGKENTQDFLNGRNQNLNKGTNTLWVSDMRVESYDQNFTSDGVIINLELMAVPKLQIMALNGDKLLQPLTQGRFKSNLYLIHSINENGTVYNRVLAQDVNKSVIIRNGNLFIKSPLKLTSIPTRGQLVLGLDITAENSVQNIGNFQGIYMIGDYDKLKGSGFLKLMSTVTETPQFKLTDYITYGLEENAAVDSKNKDAYVQPRIEVMPLEFKFVRVAKETTSEREIVYTIRACLRNGLEQKTTRGYTFDITGFSANEGQKAKITKIKTDNSSCLNWDETLTFKYYECQKFFKGTIGIANQELAINQKLEMAINPWESSSTFARDLRYVDSDERLLTDCRKENVLPSTLSLRSVNYTTLSYDYELDSLLNLTFKKKLRFKLDAVVSVFSDMSRGRMESAQKLRPGVYLLKMALIKNRDYYNQKTFVSSAEKLVTTLDGDIKADIEFATSDLKAIGDRNTLLVELDPVLEDKVRIDKDGNVTVKEKIGSLDDLIDRNTGLYNRTFTSAMTLNSERESQELSPLELKEANQYLISANLPQIDPAKKSLVREYIQFGQRVKAQENQSRQALSDLRVFAKNNSLKYITLKDPQGLPTQELARFASTAKLSKELSKQLCTYWFKTLIAKDLWDFYAQHGLIGCGVRANRADQLFTVEKRLFVKDLESYRFLKGYNAAVTVGQSMTMTNSLTHTRSTTKSLGFNAGISQKFLEIFSIGISGSYVLSEAESKADATSNSTSVNTNVTLLMQQNIYQLKITRYDQCSIVKIKPQHFMKGGIFASVLSPRLSEGEKAEVASQGIMICTGEEGNPPLIRNENYYLLAQDTTNAQLQDNGDARNRNFFIAVRGEKEFQRLLYSMKGTIQSPPSADRNFDGQKEVLHGLDSLLNTGLPNTPGSYNDTN